MAQIDLGRIPNVAFAKVGARGKCNIMFPALYAAADTRAVGQLLLAQFYEDVLRPALLAVDLDRLTHWPVSYELAMRRSRDANGRLHLGSIDIPVDKLGPLVVEMKLLMAGIREFVGAFFYHEVRGVKGGSVHDPQDLLDVDASFDEVCDHLDWHAIPAQVRDQFYIDIALEIRRPGHVVQWMREHHLNILRAVLPVATDGQRVGISRSPGFHCDLSAQISDFAGFRVAPGERGKDDGVVYINVYTTDKDVHYQLHKGVFSRKSPQDLLPHGIKALRNGVNEWTKSFFAASGAEEHPAQEGAARCEVRVQMKRYREVLRDWDEHRVRRLTGSIPSSVWWCVHTISQRQ